MKYLIILIYTQVVLSLTPGSLETTKEVYLSSDSFNQFVGRLYLDGGTCTGTYLSETVMITSRHCINGIDGRKLPNRQNIMLRGQIAPNDFQDISAISGAYPLPGGHDMALVVVYPPLETHGIPFPKVASMKRKFVKDNDKGIMLSGYPGSKRGELHTGCSEGYNMPKDHATVIRYDVNTEKGMSGSALRLCDDENLIIGVHNWGTTWGNSGLLFSNDDVHFIKNFIEAEEQHQLNNLDYLKAGPNEILQGECLLE